jgi:hypothetical protein
MSTRRFSILSALCCILGVVLLIISFALNPAPATNATGTQLAAFGKLYHNEILIGAWLQAISPFLILLFALAIVHLCGATTRFAGWVSMCGGMLLVIVSLVEVTFFLGAANAGNLMTAQVSLSLVRAVQHLYSIIAAPALIIPLGFVILGSHVLPHVLGYVAIVIGIVFAILGVVYLFTAFQNVLKRAHHILLLYLALTGSLVGFYAALIRIQYTALIVECVALAAQGTS